MVSVSQAGYNTVMETLQAGARAVLVPFAAGSEEEQTIRAQLLAERGLVHVVEESALTPQRSPPRSIAGARAAPGAACDREVHRIGRRPMHGGAHARVAQVTWEEFEAEIARRGGAKFWWRDDDAAAASPELRRALALSRTCAVPPRSP